MLILVLEASTAAAKALVYDASKGIVSIRTERYGGGICDLVSQDADGAASQLFALGKAAAAGFDIDVVALGSTWSSLLVLDGDMRPHTKVLLWSNREAVETETLCRADRVLAERFYNKTGCPVNTAYPAVKLRHMTARGLDMSGKYISDQGSYLFTLLTGENVVSGSMLSASGFMDITTRDYSAEQLDFAGVTRENMPDIVPHTYASKLSREGAALLGLAAGTPVIPAYPDGALNQVGEDALEPGVMTFSVGTSAALRVSTNRPAFNSNASTWCYLSPTNWLTGAATSGACNCVDWAKEKLFPSGMSYREIESQPIDIERLPIFLPFLYGERAPGWNGDRQASFCELAPGHGATEMYFSVLEGVIMAVRHCYDLLTSIVGAPKSIRLSGGICNSETWLKMCCDIMGVPLEVSESEHASLLGGAALACLALGERFVFPPDRRRILLPDQSMTGTFADRYRRYLYWYGK